MTTVLFKIGFLARQKQYAKINLCNMDHKHLALTIISIAIIYRNQLISIYIGDCDMIAITELNVQETIARLACYNNAKL